MKKTTRKIGIRPTPFDSLQTHLKVNMWVLGIKSKQQKEHGFDHKQHLPSFFKKRKVLKSYRIVNLISTINFWQLQNSTKTPIEVLHPQLATQLRVSSRKPSSPTIIKLHEGLQNEDHYLKNTVNDNPNQLTVLTSFSW